MRPHMTSADADTAIEVANKIAPLLAGLPALVQSAVIADLTGRWLAGWPPDLRDIAFKEHTALILRMVDINEEIAFGEAGHPGGRH